MGKKITIIGSGATALGAVVTFSQKGHRITIADVEEKGANLEKVKEKGGILLRGNGARGLATPWKITFDVAEAVEDAEIILVSVVAQRHREIAQLIAGRVKEDQLIVIAPGNAGSLIFHEELQKANKREGITLLELQGNLFPIRVTGPAEVNAGGGLRKKRAATFPAKDFDKAKAKLEGVIEVDRAKNIFETTLNTPNIINHLNATVLNAAAIDKKGKKFSLFLDGLTPTVFKGYDIAWEEWKKIVDQLDYWEMSSPVEGMRKVAQYDQYPEQDVFRSLDGPDSLTHRYVSEDAPCGVALLISLARKLNISIPYTEALLSIVSALNRTDYYGQGRTLEAFGLEQLSLEEINDYLENGVRK